MSTFQKKFRRANLGVKKFISMLTTAALFATPAIVSAQEITKTDSANAGTITTNGNVTNILADRMVNDTTAINQFSKFDLDADNIANMHFGTNINSTNADTLVNFVDSQANINGIVNAVQNGQVGGNLYFISSEGIAVGSSGVINAGKIGLISPTNQAYQDLLDNAQNITDSTFSAENIQNGLIPLNYTGSITVEGRLNATDGMTLAAANIDIKGGATLVNSSAIDYSSIVNVTDSQGNVLVDSGLNRNNMTVTKDSEGNLTIISKLNNDSVKSQGSLTDELGVNFSTDIAPSTAKINIENGTKIISDGDVDIIADVDIQTDFNRAEGKLANSINQSFKADVSIDGEIKGRNVNISANVLDDYKFNSQVNTVNKNSDDEENSNNKEVVQSIAQYLNVPSILEMSDISNAMVMRNDSAGVTIGENAVVNANDLNITAESTFNADLNSQAKVGKSSASAVTVNYSQNNSSVNISGQLNAAGNMSVVSNAVANLNSTSAVDLTQKESSAIAIAGNVALTENAANLDLNATSKLNAGGNLTIASKSETPTDVENKVDTVGDGLTAIGANFLRQTNSSNIKVDGNLNGYNISVQSENLLPTYKVNSHIETVNLDDKNNKNNKSQGSFIAFNTNIATPENSSHIEIAENANITAKGNLAVNSKVIMDDPQIGALIVTSTDNSGGESLSINPAVSTAQIKNDSSISTTAAKLNGSTVTINSNVNVDNARLKKLKQDVQDLYSDVKNYLGDSEQLQNFFQSLTDTDSDENILTQATTAAEIIDQLKAKSGAGELVDRAEKLFDTVTSAHKIANYYADKEQIAGNTSKDKKESASSLSMTTVIENLDNTSQVIIGKNTEITSNNDAKISSNINQVDIAVSGHIKPSNESTSTVDAVVNYFTSNTDNIIAFAEGVNVTANNLDVKADNNINHIILNDGSGKESGNSVHAAGTVSYANGESIALVSIDDETSLNARGDLNINANNNTNLLNVAGGLAVSSGAAGIGASVAVNNFDVKTLAKVGNNDISESSELVSLLHSKIDSPEKFFGTAEINADKLLNAKSIDVKAVMDGAINSLSIAGGLATSEDNKNSSESLGNNASQTAGTGSKISSAMDTFRNYFTSDESGESGGIFKDTLNKFMKSENESTGGEKPSNTSIPKISELANIFNSESADSVTDSNSESKSFKFTFDGAGSASINLGNNRTESGIENTNVNSKGNINVKATDDSFIGAWSGAGALNFRQQKGNASNNSSTSVGMTGAVGFNKIENAVISGLRNNTINVNSNSLTNTAEKTGALIAAAPSLSVQASGGEGKKNFSGAASASVSIAQNTVGAELVNNQTQNVSSLTNKAENRDTQIVGGINLSIATGGNKGTAVGGSASFAHLKNDIHATIDKGSYQVTGDFANTAVTSTNQIVGSVGVSVATGTESSYGFQGVLAYNRIENKDYATIKGATVNVSGRFDNIAQDFKIDGNKKHDAFLTKAGLDVNGQSYADEASVSKSDETLNVAKNQTSNENDTQTFNAENSEAKTKTSNYGNKIITAALAVSASGDGSGMASLAISDIDNDFESVIEGSTIDGGNTPKNIHAESNTLDINAAAGAAVSSKGFGAGGSISWQTTDNTVKAGIDSTVGKNSGLDINALSNAFEVNVAGQLSAGKGTALGLALAYNSLNDSTDAFIKNVDFTKGNFSSGNINVNAESNGSVYAVGAGVGVSTNSAALGGSIAINRGHNSTNALIENVNLNDTSNNTSINVNANDKINKLAVVGNLQASGGSAAVGGAVAYNDVGTLNSRQTTNAEIKNSNLQGLKNLSLNADDNSELTTIGVGVGAASKGAAVQGAVAVATINKDVDSLISNSNITATDKISNSSATSENITTSADVLALNLGTGAAIGAGVSINNDDTKTSSNVKSSQITGNGLELLAANNAAILNVGIGGSAGGTGAAVTGSVAVNNISGKTSSIVDDSQINSTGKNNVVVDAQSDERISNYAGSISFTGTGGAVGVSVSKNNITSETNAKITGENSSIIINRNSDGYNESSLKNFVDDGAIVDEDFAKKLFDTKNNVSDKDDDSKKDAAQKDSEGIGSVFRAKTGLSDSRQATNYHGIVISASGTHTLKSLMINGGAAGTGAAVNGTVNINQIGGSTNAVIDGAKITAGSDDVNVVAHDYTNSIGLVGTANVAGTGAAVGLGNDSEDITRTVNSAVTGQNRSFENNGDIYVNNLNVESKGRQGITSLVAGISGAGVGVGASNSTGVYLLNANTSASLNNANVKNNYLSVLADHDSKIHTLGVAIGFSAEGAGTGLGVEVLKETDRTSANIKNSNVNYLNDTNNLDIKAVNNTKLNYEIFDVGVGVIGVGAAGSIGVANVQNNVLTNIENSTFKNINYANINAENNLDFDNFAFTGAAGLGGVGVGVAVNTVDSLIKTNVDNSTIKAESIYIGATENRDFNEKAAAIGAGGVAASANVMVTNIGKELADNYESATNSGSENKDGSQVNINEKLATANDATSKNKLSGNFGDNNPANGLNVSTSEVTATKGGTSEGLSSGIETTIKNSTLEANNVDISNNAVNDIVMDGRSGAVGAVSLNGTVGILNVNKNSALNLINTNIKASDDILVENSISGTTELDITQGSAGAFAANVSYAALNSSGVDKLNISGGDLTAGSSITVMNADNSQNNVNSVGVAVGAGAVGALIAEGKSDSSNNIVIDNGASFTTTGKEIKFDDGETYIDSNINIQDINGTPLKVEANAVTGGALFAGTGIAATAMTNGSTEIVVGEGVKFNSKNLSINAMNFLDTEAITSTKSGSMLYSSSLTGVKNQIGSSADNPANVTIKINKNVSLNADAVNISGLVIARQNLDMVSFSAGTSAIGASVGNINSYAKSNVEIDNVNFKENSSVNINSQANISPEANVRGLTVGFVANGNEILNAERNISSNVALLGNNSATLPNDISINANTLSLPTFSVNGDGGGLVSVSPDAAVLNDNSKMSANVELAGNLSINKTFDVKATNFDGGKLSSNAAGAAVVGASAVKLNRTQDASAQIDIADGTKIKTGGNQNYTAENQIELTEELLAGGFGGVSGTGSSMNSPSTYKANVNIGTGNGDKVVMTTSGDNSGISIDAQTVGSINTKNKLDATGVVAMVIAGSDFNTNLENIVNVNNATLQTFGKNSDISFGASENVTLRFLTAANLNGGLGGVTYADTNSILNRTNKISVNNGTKIDSSRDVNFYADADSLGNDTNLTLNVLSDAYNKTLVPLSTKPKLKNTMTENNQVIVNSGATVNSTRDINLRATVGEETIVESAREYNSYTGVSGQGSLVSTALGEKSSNESINNFVELNGNLNAGNNNELDIVISNENGVDTSKAQNVVNMKPVVKINKGSDWFSADQISHGGSSTIKNPFLEDYNTTLAAMKNYQPSSDSYKALKSQADNLAALMVQYGFAEKGSQNDYKIYENSVLSTVSVQKILLGGGSINVEGNQLKGTGNLKARSSIGVNIKNETPLTLDIQGIDMAGKGGGIIFNGGSVIKNGTSFNTVDSDLTGNNPVVNIEHTGRKITDLKPDILVSGNITNTAGNVKISTANGSIDVMGNIVAGGGVEILAPNGGFILNDSKGLYNVGNDPIAMFTFGNKKVSDELEKAISMSVNTKTWSTYDEYLRFIFGKLDNATKQETGSSTNYNTWSNNIKSRYGWLNSNDEPRSSIVVNGPVSIVAKDININGLIQSGFANYNGKIDSNKISSITNSYTNNVNYQINKILFEKDLQTYAKVYGSYSFMPFVAEQQFIREFQSKIKNYSPAQMASWISQQIGKRSSQSSNLLSNATSQIDIVTNQLNQSNTLKDSEVLGNEKYLVNSNANKTWNSNIQAYDGVVKIYYNPTTKHFLTDELNVGGGVVYLKGNIISTGGGSIIAAKGAADINIDTSGNNSDLYLGVINNSDRAGRISIIDTSKNSLNTIYTNNNEARNGYNPAKNSSYSWTGGISYTTTVSKQYSDDSTLWGAIDTGSTSTFIKAVGNKATTLNTRSSSGDLLPNGIFVSNKSINGVLTADTKSASSSNWVSSAISTNSDRHGFLWINKTVTYNWTETRGNSNTTNYYVPADKNIRTGFITGNGNINVTSGGSLYVNGNIQNAGSGRSFGAVNLTSTNGEIKTANDKRIITDEINLNAAKNIDITHNGISDFSKLNALSNSGNITIDSAGGLNIENVSAKNGIVDIRAYKNIKSSSTDSLITARRIDLTSSNGNIGAGHSVNIDVVEGEIQNGDTMSHSLNATANGNINLKEVSGDMRLGYIESKTGDVELSSTGNIIDVTNQEYTLSDSDDKVQNWIDLGIINGDAAADSSSEIAATEKQSLMTSLEQRARALAEGSEERLSEYAQMANLFAKSHEMQNAKTFYAYAVKNAKDDVARTSAQREYDKRIKAFFNGMGFSDDEISIIVAYAGIKDSNAFGFSKNQLLYAINDSILNSSPGQTVNVEKPNIIANTLTISASGGIGIDDTTSTVIKAADLTNLDNLKILSNVKAGDLTWGMNKSSVTVKKQNPISIQLRSDGTNTGGNLSSNPGKHTYLVGTNNTTFNISNSFGSGGYNVRLMTDNGIKSYNSNNVITAKDAILYGGAGNIGGQSQNETLRLNMTGALDANSAKSIYLHGEDRYPLTIQAISAGENIYIVGDNSIIMSTETGKDTGRLTGANINISSEKNIGVVGNGLRITNNGVNASLTANYNDIFVNGIGKGSLNFRSINTRGNKFGFITEGTANLYSKYYNLESLRKIYYGQ